MTEKKTKLTNVEVVHKGAQIILPQVNGKPMSYDEAITWMKRKKEEDEREVGVYHELECSPLDGAVAFHKALAKKYGWTALVPTPGFFADRPPVMVGVAISANETIQVPIGRVEIPGIDGYLETNLAGGDNPHFKITGKVRQKNSAAVNEIVALTKKFLTEESIYRGKAIKVDFSWSRDDDDEDGYHPIEDAPTFMPLDGIKDDDLIFGERTLNDINIGLFTPIEQADSCRRHGVPLKRGVLLYGPYGTGKTMTAYVSALKAVRSGWTFIYLESVQDLKKGLEFAAKYAPCVLFAEDIDRVITGERSLSMDDVLNTLDGIDTKGAEIITVFTTNHIEVINPAMLRMGRLDTLVEVLPPDAKAAERLVKLYSRGLLSKEANLSRIGKTLEGQIPAFIREVTERAKIAAIARIGNDSIEGKVLEEDLISAAKAMETHANMLKPREEPVNNDAELFVRVPANHQRGKLLLASLNGEAKKKTA
jgi:transitional endoplasmic reticulum ATPase